MVTIISRAGTETLLTLSLHLKADISKAATTAAMAVAAVMALIHSMMRSLKATKHTIRTREAIPVSTAHMASKQVDMEGETSTSRHLPILDGRECASVVYFALTGFYVGLAPASTAREVKPNMLIASDACDHDS